MEPDVHPTRLVILEKALECFSDLGFKGTSFKTLMEGTGHPPSLVVYHFGSKENLYLETFKYLFSIFPFRVAIQPEVPEHVGPLSQEEAMARLVAQVQTLADEVLPHNTRFDARERYGARLWVREWLNPRPFLHDLFREKLSPFVSNIRSFMRALHPDLPDSEIDLLGAALIGQVVTHTTMFGLNQVIWGKGHSEVSRERSIELIVRSCLYGFAERLVAKPTFPAPEASGANQVQPPASAPERPRSFFKY
jgi:AcrR family transcriptional regulator